MIKSIQNIFTEEQPEVKLLIDECKVAFNCRNVAEKDNYSVGSTYFVPINGPANCGVEKLAQDVFRFHVNRLGLLFNEESSGSEWWTQVIDCRDDIGFHWDRDYGLEEKDGSCLYPNIATVTYLSNLGGPTIIMEREGDLTTDSDISCNLSRCFLSSPKFGKHFSFPGSLLHAAPSDLLYHPDSDSSEEHESDDSSVQSSTENHPVRITFLVNLWINHIPENCSRYDPPKNSAFNDYPSSLRNLANAASSTAATLHDPSMSQLTIPVEERERVKWLFNHGEDSYEVSMPALATEEEAADVMEKARSNVLLLQFAGSNIEITKVDSERETVDEEEDEEESKEDGDDDDDDDDDIETDEGEDEEEANLEGQRSGIDSSKRKAVETLPLAAAKKRT